MYHKRKPLRQIGKVGRKWIETRAEWIKQNPAVDGLWYCYVCHCPLTIAELTLDHVKSRSRSPELRFDLSNLKPCCSVDNFKKGSKSY